MKKIFSLFVVLFSALGSFSQSWFPVNSTLGSPNSTVLTKGISSADSGFQVRTNFADTTTANYGNIKSVPGVIIRTASKLWLRNQTATGWVEIGSGSGGSGTVTSISTGYGLSGGTITTSGTLLLDSATVSNYFIRRKDSLTGSNLLGYVTRKILADTAAAIRAASGPGTSVNIYNSDGTLTGNRQVLGGASYNLTFDGMQLFGVTASSISLTSGISTVNISDSVVFDNTQGFSIRTLSSDDDTTTYKPLGYDPVTGKVVTRSSWVGGGGGTPTLQEVLATESNIAIIDNTDILPSTSGLDLVFGDTGSTLWNDIVLKGDGTVQMEAQTSTNSKSSLFGATPDSVQINAYLGQINIDSLRSWTGTTISDTTYKKVMTWDTRNGRWEYGNWLGAGGGGVTTVASINGTTKSANGAVISGSNLYMQTVDGTYPGLMTSAQKARLDSNSYLTIDKRYDSLAWRRNDSTFLVKSLRLQLNGATVTPTVTDSSLSYDIIATAAVNVRRSIEKGTGDSLQLVNDSASFVGANKVYGYSNGVRGWKDVMKMTLTNQVTGDAIIVSGDSLTNGRKVDTIYRTAGKDSIIYLISGTRYAIKDSTGGGGGGSAAGNYGNVQLNRNGSFATPASDSLNFTAGSGLNVKGTYLIGGQVVAKIGSGTNTSIYGNGGTSATGAYNTVLGVGAAANLTSGTYNTLIGSRVAGSSTVTGVGNTGVGEAALYFLSGGGYNTGIGPLALNSVANGSSNTALGYEALQATTGSNNVGIGRGAGYANTSGGQNLVIGFQTHYYNSTGSNNTIIGYQAALGVTGNSNSNNTAVGYKSLNVLTTGSNNIILGYQAADNLTSGSNNIVIGYDIDVPSATGSNQMTIANAIFGTGLTGSGTTTAGKIGILNNAPDSTFDVTGGVKITGGFRLTGIPNGGSSSSDSLLVATSSGQTKKINPSIFALALIESSYTPTLTNTTNIAASTAYTTYYTMQSNTIHVWGTVDIDATTASSVCEMGFSLPVSSNVVDIYEIAGTAAFEDNTSVQIKGDVANDRAVWRFTPQTNTNNKYSFHFTYKYNAP